MQAHKEKQTKGTTRALSALLRTTIGAALLFESTQTAMALVLPNPPEQNVFAFRFASSTNVTPYQVQMVPPYRARPEEAYMLRLISEGDIDGAIAVSNMQQKRGAAVELHMRNRPLQNSIIKADESADESEMADTIRQLEGAALLAVAGSMALTFWVSRKQCEK